MLSLLSFDQIRSEITVEDVTEEKEEKKKEPEPELEEKYDVKVLKLGESDSENFSEHGIITNNFDGNLTRELLSDNNHPSLIYTCDSKKIHDRNSEA